MRLKLPGILIVLMLAVSICQAQTIWTGSPVTVNKLDSADWTLAENQDRITDSVWITRQHSQAFYNIALESRFTGTSPKGTEWAVGSIDSIASLKFQPFIKAAQHNPQGLIDTPMVLHLIKEDIYISFKLLQFSGVNMGGFKYERSTDQTAGIEDIKNTPISIYPNPASDFLQLNAVLHGKKVDVFNLAGVKMLTATVPSDGKILINELKAGTYILKSENTAHLRFIKW
jgi:hypothetical protein